MTNKSGVPGSLRRRVFERDGYTCRKCHLRGYRLRHPSGAVTNPTAHPGVYLSIDHVIPQSMGGESVEANLQTLCTDCNRKKGTTL